jgi:hypothetical protein
MTVTFNPTSPAPTLPPATVSFAASPSAVRDTLGSCAAPSTVVESPFTTSAHRTYAPLMFSENVYAQYLEGRDFDFPVNRFEKVIPRLSADKDIIMAWGKAAEEYLEQIKPSTHPADRAVLYYRARKCVANQHLSPNPFLERRIKEQIKELRSKQLLACEEAASVASDIKTKWAWLLRALKESPELNNTVRDETPIEQLSAFAQIWQQVGDLLLNPSFLLSKEQVPWTLLEDYKTGMSQEALAATAYRQAGKLAKERAWQLYSANKEEILPWQNSYKEAHSLFAEARTLATSALAKHRALFNVPTSNPFELPLCAIQDSNALYSAKWLECHMQENMIDVEFGCWHAEYMLNFLSKNGKNTPMKALHRAYLEGARIHEELSKVCAPGFKGYFQIKQSRFLWSAAKRIDSLKLRSELLTQAYTIAYETISTHRVICEPIGNNVCPPHYLSDLKLTHEKARRAYIESQLRAKQSWFATFKTYVWG